MKHPLDVRLETVFAADALFAVGGRVRDDLRLAGGQTERPPKDHDYVVVGLELEDVVQRLRTVGRVDLVGASFAVLKFRSADGDADVALPRREQSTGVGHRDFLVESGPSVSLADDLGRRDFRMNMIARRVSDGILVDPYGGVADVAARRIDVVRAEAFEEDPLRMLRAAQFAARFDYRLSDAASTAMRASAGRIATVSPERIGDEVGKLLTLADRPSVGLEILREHGLLALIWPELLEGVGVDQNEWHAYDVYRHNLVTVDASPPGDLTLRLAALLHDVGKPRTKDGPHFYRHEHVGADMVPSMLERIRLPHDTIETVTHLVRQHMYNNDPAAQPKTIRRFVQRIGVAQLGRLFGLRSADIAGSGLPKRDDTNERFQARVAEIVAEAPAFSVRDLAVGGAEVIAALQRRGAVASDYRGDERVGRTLRWLFEQVTDEPSRNQPDLLAALIERYLDAEATRAAAHPK